VSRLVRGVRLSTLPSTLFDWTRTARCALSRVFSPRTFVRSRNPHGARAVRAAWACKGGRCYSLTPASADPIPMHPFPSVPVGPLGPRLCVRGAATPLGVLDADPPRLVVLRRLEEPSSKSSRPLTSHVVLGHHRVGSKPTGSCRRTRRL